jgi:hypothetical protein
MMALVQRFAFMLLSVVGAVVGSVAQDAQFPRLTPELLPILEVLDSAALSGSLEISGSCDKGSFPHFPHLGKETSGPPLQALGEIFSSSAVSVTQDSNGNVRMIEPGLPVDFLNVRIHRINFKNDFGNDIFIANHALLLVLEAPEVKTYSRKHNINVVFSVEVVNGPLVQSWPPGSTRMSGTLENVTVREALDQILHTFHGIWVYENCPQIENHERSIFLRFYHLSRRGNSIFVGQ